MRNIVDIIDQIIAIAPDLDDIFKSLRSSALYTAPELMHERWNQAAYILNTHAKDHPKKVEISKIFSGT